MSTKAKSEAGKSKQITNAKQKKTNPGVTASDEDFSLALRRPRRESKLPSNTLKDEDEAQLELAIKLSLQAQRAERKKNQTNNRDEVKMKKKSSSLDEDSKSSKKLKKKISPPVDEKEQKKSKKKLTESVEDGKERKKSKKKPPVSTEGEKEGKKAKKRSSPSVEQDKEQIAEESSMRWNQLSFTDNDKDKHCKKQTSSTSVGRSSPLKKKKSEYVVDIDKTLKADKIPSTASFISYVLQKGSNNRDMDLVKQFEREETHQEFNIVASPNAQESESDWENA